MLMVFGGRLQFAVAALRRGEGVVWVDAGHPLPGPRLEAVLAASFATTTSEAASQPPSQPPHPSPSPPPTASTLLKNLTTFTPPTLPHLLALLAHPLPPRTSLLILSSPSSLLPPPPIRQHTPSTSTSNPITPLINALRRLAATSHIALLVLSQTVTQLQPHGPAALVPAIGGAAWEGGVGGRVVLWREGGGRFVRVVRRGGRGVEGRVGGFVVTANGIEDAPIMEGDRELVSGRKRKAEEILEGGVRLGDDDYGWDEGDEVGMPLLGPQTQGSEDVLVVPEEETETEEEEGWEGEGEGSGGETPRGGGEDGDARGEEAMGERVGLPLSP
ncbi:hypothetical protein VE01_07483 [Pseudogymnoascus verrucosus]|uniref:DNA recombination and repair protein Rad51-like C-terminal domain-containing protein n=1 Tax=Pseudogymnoascus verrucosus TaxID=342668 RepID=A0A1B8GGE7_9PEZI|nr:uncharacterized protein VE01_07483 [Pseudogymnoascus verrucosus]OBT94908.2 hypothetical protein VE01_07483 [Pseudogymnoascus verrucosus]